MTFIEHLLRTGRREIGEGSLVEQARIHRALVGQVLARSLSRSPSDLATSWRLAGQSRPIVSPVGQFRLPDLNLCGPEAKPSAKPIGCVLNLLLLPQGALPDRGHAPPRLDETGAHGIVPHYVGGKLGLPEFRTRRGGRGEAAPRMAVPEAAMHEHYRSESRKNEIRLSLYLFSVKPVAESTGMQGAAQHQLGLRVLASDPGHHPGTGLRVYDIGHVPPGLQSGNCYTPSECNSSGA